MEAPETQGKRTVFMILVSSCVFFSAVKVIRLVRFQGRQGGFMYYNIEESGKRIAELRKKKKLTQEGLAEVIGMSHETINSIEKGKKGTSIDTLVLIAEALDTSMDYIVTGKIDENSELSRIFQGLSNDKKELALRIFKGIIENL